MAELITLPIFVLGLMTVVISVIVAFRFFSYIKKMKGSGRQLSNAIAWQLVGEAIIGFGTLIFSLAAYTGALDNWNIYVQSAIRFVMFFATAFTTVHLLRTLHRLSD